VKTYYWLGKFDSETGQFIPQDITPKAIDSNALSIGGTGFVTPDGRSVLFLIAQGMRSSDADGAAGYAHCAALPLELWAEGGELRIKPIDEVKNLRGNELASLSDSNEEQVNQALKNIDANEYEIIMELPNEDFTVFIGNKTLSYYKASSDFGFRSDAYAGSPAVVNVNGDTVTLRILVDRSLVECFLDEKVYCATRVYKKDKEQHSISIMIDDNIKVFTVNGFI
jgi:sucrose-6-phosphate hydrolase SacC (GH32 family)